MLRNSRSIALVAIAWWVLLHGAVPGDSEDLRSRELVRYRCDTEMGWSETTLFGNGTVRVKQVGGPALMPSPQAVDPSTSGAVTGNGPNPTVRMRLAELTPLELRAYSNRLGDENLEQVSVQRGVPGDWVERCELALHLIDRQPLRFEFGRFDTLSLTLSRVVRIVEEIGSRDDLLEAAPTLPRGYTPRWGDRLRRADGVLFEVVRFDVAGQGVELRAVEQPITIYVARAQLGDTFVEFLGPQR